ncbi:MAG: response regulator transcription factor [Bacilli bacterium]|nr:response regulator transcription factor [Bacilli bacterium]
MMNILIVDDEEKIREVIGEYCKNEGYQTTTATNGQEALEQLQNSDCDLLILDIMMPKMDGFELLKNIPESKRVPIIILSARDDEIDKLEGFRLGIDDYVTKPFSPKELMARVRAVANRSNIEKKEIYVLDTLEVNFKAHTIKIDNKRIDVTPKEFEILSYLINNKNIAISREQLLTKVWKYDFFGEDRTIDTHIKMLRNNLGKYRNLIETVRGIGYKFNDEE